MERVSIQERISAHAAYSQIIVAASCLLDLGTDTSQTDFPSRDLSITARSYRSKLKEWADLIHSRRRQGAQLHLALDEKSQMKEAESTGAIEKALERLNTDINSDMDLTRLFQSVQKFSSNCCTYLTHSCHFVRRSRRMVNGSCKLEQ